MSVIGLIPARGGSKGLPRKNVLPLAGRPLIAWTAQAARAAKRLDRVIVSTDDDEIAAVARAAGLDVPFMRPADLASDDASALAVMTHAVEWLEQEGSVVDALVYLQPTSPFRSADDIDAAVALLADADTVVSVVEVPHNMVPSSLMQRRADGMLEFLLPPVTDNFRRQAKERLYARNGPAVLAVRRETLRRGKLYGDRVASLVMPLLRSIDIDTAEDLRLAQTLLPLLETS